MLTTKGLKEITLDEVYDIYEEHCKIIRELNITPCNFFEFCEHVKNDMGYRII